MSIETDSRIGVWVHGICASCGDVDTLLYAAGEDLVCAVCRRAWSVSNPTKQACDRCGDTGNVWRDPVHRRNEYLCIKCHDPEALFQNRWANKARESKPLSDQPRAQCAARGHGTDCRGEIKWRSAFNMQLCNKHAGKQGVGPNG